jgi:hypothetical protein
MQARTGVPVQLLLFGEDGLQLRQVPADRAWRDVRCLTLSLTAGRRTLVGATSALLHAATAWKGLTCVRIWLAPGNQPLEDAGDEELQAYWSSLMR